MKCPATGASGLARLAVAPSSSRFTRLERPKNRPFQPPALLLHLLHPKTLLFLFLHLFTLSPPFLIPLQFLLPFLFVRKTQPLPLFLSAPTSLLLFPSVPMWTLLLQSPTWPTTLTYLPAQQGLKTSLTISTRRSLLPQTSPPSPFDVHKTLTCLLHRIQVSHRLHRVQALWKRRGTKR